MPHPPSAPTFLSKAYFLRYVDEVEREWRVETRSARGGSSSSVVVEAYVAKYVVVASGENSEACVPQVEGLEGFMGEVVHSKDYKSGFKYKGKEVLVVGSGNSGMEIAYDLNHWGAQASVVIRSPVHVVTKELVHQGMFMLRYFPMKLVDAVTTLMAKLEYGDLSKYGIRRPNKGPFYLKQVTGRSPVIDVGTIAKIKEGAIKNKKVVFENNMEKEFDAIIFATGFRSAANNWLKDFKYILNENGMPKNEIPKHWKGENGIYCAGLSRRGLFGVSMDAQAIADDINHTLKLELAHEAKN
ncbi:putative indole-3-pyruvate monooxygenase YUCCA10 [Senna tora]|uniref:Flavin-containing monooxygenase n=1 Tax=Senna tora TaxID=362788 RepID=A0A834X8K6_9FABA|nr:putative indole-3-pyruvate monooxygenase YUCCA10 [Senna tora]